MVCPPIWRAVAHGALAALLLALSAQPALGIAQQQAGGDAWVATPELSAQQLKPSSPAAPLGHRPPKTCVYAIALNERKHVESFMAACKGADLVMVADTGSADGTLEALRARAATVHSITVKPWRFDVARNMALDLLPADCDLCLSLDLDEQLQPGWVEALQEAWALAGTSWSYRYDDSASGIGESQRATFHARWNYTWRGPAHELPYWTGARGGQRQVTLLNLKAHHYADPTKTRGSCLGLLKLGAEEDPTDVRRSYYYGREPVFQKQHAAAVQELERYLTLPGAWWKEERSAAVRFIVRCHEALGQHKEAQDAARRAIAEWDKDREPFMALARASRLLGDWPTCRWAATAALAIKEKLPSSFGDITAWGAAPHDEAALALYHLGQYERAVQEGKKALALDPANKRLQANLLWFDAEVQALRRSAAATKDSWKTAGCTLSPRFLGYRPSAWEREWSTGAMPGVASCQDSLCPAVTAYPDHIQTWLDGVRQAPAALGGNTDAASLKTWAANDRTVFSVFEWEDPCRGEIITAPIEPLVGHFRHPLGPQCNRSSTVHIEDRTYLLLSGLTEQQFKRLYPGHRLLMDFGSSSWPDSLGWLVDRYSERGVDFFDEIWAWEVTAADHTKYWSKVPAQQRHRLHFYNVPVGGDVSAVDHPVQWLKQLVKPGDFLAIKLDIDHSPTEMAFMQAVKADAELRDLISEMMFEMHYEHTDMSYGMFRAQGPGVTWRNVFDFFEGLRKDGLRLHYWP